MRSKETGMHIHRMAAYSKLLAQLYGLPSDQLNLLEAAAPLHDIGKVAIPDAILTKPGRLTEDEMDTMRTHAQSGFDLLGRSNSKMLETGAQVALTATRSPIKPLRAQKNGRGALSLCKKHFFLHSASSPLKLEVVPQRING